MSYSLSRAQTQESLYGWLHVRGGHRRKHRCGTMLTSPAVLGFAALASASAMAYAAAAVGSPSASRGLHGLKGTCEARPPFFSVVRVAQ